MKKIICDNRELLIAKSITREIFSTASENTQKFWLLIKTCLPVRKALLIMKLTILFVALSLFTAHANTYSQTITFTGNNVSLTKILNSVEKQTGYSFLINKSLLNETTPVSLSVKNMPVIEFLDLVFRDQPVTYEINNRTIFVKRKIVTAVSQSLDVKPEIKKEKTLVEITGTVTGVDGAPLAGATITIKGTRISTTTNSEGRFSINAEPDQVLVITYVGYKSAEITIGDRTNINVSLEEIISEIEQVVVTALGISKKARSLTYNVQEIKGEEMTKVKDANFINNLAGRVAGASINTSASGVGGSVRVVMRGAKSLFGNNNTLYVVDGIPLPNLHNTQPADVFQGAGQSGDGISNINPEDIASISILTGPAAAALYGSDAANGVVLITTKKASGERFSLDVSNSTLYFNPLIMPEFQNRYGSNPGSYYSWGGLMKVPGTYNPQDFFQTGLNVTNTISLSTGNERNQTYFSAAMVNAKGIIPNNKLTRYNFSIRNTASFLNDKLNLDVNAMYINLEEQNMLSQGQYFNPLIPVYLFPLGDDIKRYEVYERYNPARNFNTQFWPYGDLGFQMQNPHWIINRDYFLNDKKRYVLSTALKYNLTNEINITGRVKLDDNKTIAEKKFYASTSGLFASPAGAYYRSNQLTQQLYTDIIANINKSFTNEIGLSVNAGASLMDTKYDMSGYGGNLLSVPNLFHFSNLNQTQSTPIQELYHDQVQSVFVSGQISHRNRLFLDLTGRNDWSSALVKSTSKSIFYPSIGVSGILTDLLGVRSRILSFAKIRGSYSEVGNAPQRFVTITTYPIIGGFPVTSSYLPATELQPERTKSFEVGLNLKFLRNRISLDVTAYKSNTFNQLFNPVLAPSTGYSSFYVNAGEVQNKGIEASLGSNLKFGKFTWTSTATFDLNRNKIIQLLTKHTDHTTGHTVSVDSLSLGGTGSYMMALVKGGSVGDIYVNTLAVDEHGFIVVGLVSQTVIPEPNKYIKAGNANPRYNIGFRNGISYSGFDLNFLVTARIGGVCVSVTQAIMDRFGVSETSAKARDQGGVLINNERIPAEPYYSVVGGGVAGIGSMYVYSATNVRLAEASLSYTIPGSLFKNRIKGITISVIGRNLYMFNRAPFDPELTANTGTYYQGIDYFMQPSLRSFGFSTRLQF